MELRATEERVDDMLVDYNAVRLSAVLQQEGVTLPPWAGEQLDTTKDLPTLSSLADTLVKLTEALTELDPKILRYRQRLHETDPVTEKPRYGEKTHARVSEIVQKFDFLLQYIPVNKEDPEQNKAALLRLRLRHDEQQEQIRQAELEEEQRKEREEATRQREEEDQKRIERENELEEERRRQEDEVATNAELRRLAEAARARRQQLDRAEQEWVNSISKGPEGVREQLKVLKDSTVHDPAVQARALQSLYTIFQQINAHPEEVSFRRIRRDHPKFLDDVGKYKGGVEVLIAAGFELGAIDDVPSYISREPDIEKEMDAWSSWFDLLKATLEILEQEQPVTKRR